jgi:hypothetical protein
MFKKRNTEKKADLSKDLESIEVGHTTEKNALARKLAKAAQDEQQD